MALDSFLKKHITKEKNLANYIKIGDSELGVFGNKYFITPSIQKEFETVYKKYVFSDRKETYLVERQLDIGKFVIDLDFRYNVDIIQKQHNIDHVRDFVELCVNGLNDIFQDIHDKTISFFIFEKENVNCQDSVTKDGIHLIFNIVADFATKLLFRNYLLKEIADVWDDLPLKNDWDSVIDEGVVKGNCGWQLYGSRKPGNEPYKLKYIFEASVHDESISIDEIDIKFIDFDKYFPYFCARNKDNCHQYVLSEKMDVEYQKILNTMSKKLKVTTNSKCNKLGDIKCVEDLDSMLETLFDDSSADYTLKEIHNYTMALPKEYWGSGSYDKWIRVGWALKNSDEKLLLTWFKFCSQSEDFDFDNNDAVDYWENGELSSEEGLSYKSILYWCKISNPDEYKKIYNNTVDYYIYYSFRNNTECDLANTLFQMYKSQYICTSIGNNIWYEFKNNRWELNDRGSALRLKISTSMYKRYEEKLFAFQSTVSATQNNMILPSTKESADETIKPNNMSNLIVSDFKDNAGGGDTKDLIKKRNEMSATCKLLKKTVTKNNIMKESQEIFWDKHFYNKLDKNPYLLGCTNCVIDFSERKHRCGRHDDYVSKSTNLTYHPLEYYEKNKPHVIQEIKDFMKQLFPDTENVKTSLPDSSLRNYMWEHLASTLLGTNENQTFNIYNGSGANGKSKLVELLSIVLGDYKGTVPISLITQKRTNIGGHSSEIYNLIGTRYAVMQEPSKNDKINEGIMKELTGGDPIQCRALFKDSVTFIPQFKLAVCTNDMLDVASTDDGTWRRLRKVDFVSKFTEHPYKDPRFSRDEYKYQFKIDTKLDEKFKSWAPVLLSMLAEISYEKQGCVTDVEPVLASTELYRKDQDIIFEFHDAIFDSRPCTSGYGIKQRDILTKFKDWYGKMYVGKMMPSGKEVHAFLEKKYGKYPGHATGWLKFSYKNTFDAIDGFSE